MQDVFMNGHAGVFYAMLGNTSPRHRSKLKMILLVAICKTKYIKQYTTDAVLQPILNDLRQPVICLLNMHHQLLYQVMYSLHIISLDFLYGCRNVDTHFHLAVVNSMLKVHWH